MSARRGRRRRDWIVVVEQIAAAIDADPTLSANRVQREFRLRRDYALRLTAVLRRNDQGAEQ